VSGVQRVSSVRVEPLGAEFDVRHGESVIQAAWRAGFQWPTTCWGQAECGVCAMEILSGVELLDPAGKVESDRLRSLPRREGGGRRLACQTRIVGAGTVTVRKPGVRARVVEGAPPAGS
jgi:ferredoxin, 2Fe-2S